MIFIGFLSQVWQVTLCKRLQNRNSVSNARAHYVAFQKKQAFETFHKAHQVEQTLKNISPIFYESLKTLKTSDSIFSLC